MKSFAGKKPYIIILLVVILTYSIFFYLQSLHEQTISNRLLEDQRNRQSLLTQSITHNIGSDLDGTLQRIKALAETFRLSNPIGTDLENQLKPVLSDIRKIAPFDELFVVNKNGTGVRIIERSSDNSSDSFQAEPFRQTDTSDAFAGFIQNSLADKQTQFSSGYNADGQWKIAISTPVFNLNNDNETYDGFIGISIPTLDLVQRYGNVLDPTRLRLVFYDKNATLLAGYPLPNSVIGKSMFSVENQNIISDGGRESVNELFRKVLSGRNYSAVIDIGDGLRLVSGSPIDVEGKPAYYLNIPTPFSHILMPVQNLLHTELVLNVIILIAFTAVMSYLVYIMSQWGSKMGKEVKQRTQEIQIANRSLEERTIEMQILNTDLGNANKKLNNAYEDLKKQDRLQKEFVNIVAHELRTPAQAIIGFIQLIEMNPGNYSLYIERLKRNTSRLERLIQDTLDLARIESETFRLTKEKTDLRELIQNVVEDSDFNIIDRQKNNLRVIHEKGDADLIVDVDKSRITQVLSNLISNANKFTTNGNIDIITTKLNDKKEIQVRIIDNGNGIDKEILPRLFGKFVSKSNSGTGIGLYISKKIILAHDGRIWGKNSENANGAEFGFSLPFN